MAIDWLTGNFYFVDDVDDRIFVCDKDGQTCVTLLDQELYNPKGIALDPTMGLVSSPYCFNTNRQTKVKTSDFHMQGSCSSKISPIKVTRLLLFVMVNF